MLSNSVAEDNITQVIEPIPTGNFYRRGVVLPNAIDIHHSFPYRVLADNIDTEAEALLKERQFNSEANILVVPDTLNDGKYMVVTKYQWRNARGFFIRNASTDQTLLFKINDRRACERSLLPGYSWALNETDRLWVQRLYLKTSGYGGSEDADCSVVIWAT